jgi:glycosyltransferase involved in cell wall biosynthesis
VPTPPARRSPAAPVQSLEVVFSQERDVDGWEQRHARGEVPSRWPYGLDKLGAGTGGFTLTRAQARPSSRRTRVEREVRSRVGRSGAAGRAILTWDENTYGRIAPVPRGVRVYPGVIWLTDAPRDSPAVRRRAALLRRADAVWCTSAAQVQPLRELLGHDGPPVHFVPFGIDHTFFTPAPYPERPLVVSVGGDRDRDTKTLFEALTLVRSAVPEAEVVVQAKTTMAPPDGVTVVERFSHLELRDLYRRMSVMVIATRPNVHVSGLTVSLESMATARPVVITGTPGMTDYLPDGEMGAVVDGAPALADAAVALLRDPDTAAAQGLRGRSVVEGSFTTGHLCRALDEMVLGTRDPVA